MADQEQIEAVIAEMYAMVSGPAGPRNWSRQEHCFVPWARQIRTSVDEDGRPQFKAMGLEDYARDTASFFAANDFFEVETGCTIQIFGNIAHAWSHYEARSVPDDRVPERSGVNSIQLFRDPERGWRIVSMLWDNAR